MDDDQQFCLRWNNHQSTLISVFDTLLENETLVDCTLAAEGKFLKAHKVVLSACSPYFATLLQEQYDKHPIFILKDVKYQELRAMMDYMYRGEVNISQDQLAALLKAAESLQIKGLSDNRSAGGTTAPKPEHHRATMPTGKLSAGYTLEQTKRARIAGPVEPEMASREGSSSPSRRRRKVRRRSIENAMTDVHDNSNSSQQLQQQTHQSQSNASGLGAITAAASALAAAAAAAPNTQSLATNIPLSASTSSSTAVTAPGTTLSSSKKTDIVKGTTQQQTQQQDAMNTENVQGPASAATATGSLDTETTDAGATAAIEKSNHKQMQQQQQHHKQAKESMNAGASGAPASSATDLVIEPKAEYDDEANDEPVEDLTLDEEDMGMDDLDQNAGTSQGGEGSSQGYAPWQHDRSQDELLLATQEAQQRDPQDDSTPLRSSSFLHRRRHSIRLKTSPLTSPLITTGPGVIKYEPSTGLDENDDDDDDEDENKLVVSGLEHKPPTSGISGNGGGGGVHRTHDEEDDDDGESEQPCDLRLSSHFKLNLVSMALQQAAVVAATGDQKTAAAMAAAMMSSGGAAAVAGGSSGMPPATQLQQTIQTIAAVATSHQAPHHALHHQAQQHAAAAAHHALMNFPTGAASPSRRYSTSSGGGGGGGGGGPGVSVGASGLMAGAPVGSGSSGSGVLTSSSSSAIVGASTSTIVAPHTPSSTGGSSGGMMGGQGVAGPGSAGATGASGSGGSGGSTTSWGGAYTCERCGNSYARPHSLNRHVRFECGVEPKFECPICHKKSKHKHNLVLHMRTHQHR